MTKPFFPNVGGLSLTDFNSFGYAAFPGEAPLPNTTCELLRCPEGMTSFVQPIPDHTGRRIVAYIGVGATGVELVARRFNLGRADSEIEVLLVFRMPSGENGFAGLSFADFDKGMARLDLAAITDEEFVMAWLTTPFFHDYKHEENYTR